MFAIAVSHPDGALRLFGTIDRKPAGDVYVNWIVSDQRSAGPGAQAYRPHGSYHASGQRHSKSYNRAAVVSHRQRPDVNFSGSENIETVNADRMADRRLPACDPTEYAAVMTFPLDLVTAQPDPRMVYLSVDLVEPGKGPLGYGGREVVLLQQNIQDVPPHILVTLFDVSNCR